ncbi:MAG: MFS transporter [Acaryochloridaceae cyanobacterium RU_4_10]|nr:MFS transporter [Acaryochloridaceae cyanobacterium RU_4_10]
MHPDRLPQPSPRSTANRATIAIVAEGFLSRLSFGIISFALPIYAHRLGLTLFEIGVLMTLNQVVAMVLKPAMGWVADRVGLKRSFTASIVVRSLIALCLVVATSPWQLYAIKAIHGGSKALRDPAANALIAEHGGKKAIASAFAWYHTAKIAAGSMGKAIAGILLTATASNFAFAFNIAFLLSLFPLYSVIRYLKPDKPRETTAIAASQSESPLLSQPSDEIDELTSLPPTGTTKSLILSFSILSFAINGTAEMLRGLFPILATEYAGLSEAETGLIYIVSTVIVLVSGPIFGWLADRGRQELVLLVRSFGNIVSSIVYILAPNLVGFTIGKLSDDAGKGAFRPVWGAIMAQVSSYAPQHRAQTMSWMLVGEDAGAIAGPILAGLLWSTWGLPIMLGVRVLLAIATEAYTLYLTRSLEGAGHKNLGASLSVSSETNCSTEARELPKSKL